MPDLKKIPTKDLERDVVYLMRVDFLSNDKPAHEYYVASIQWDGTIEAWPEGNDVGWPYEVSDDPLKCMPTWGVPFKDILALMGEKFEDPEYDDG